MRRVLGLLGGVTWLAGCTPVVGADAAPHATVPVCADVILAMPHQIGDALPQLPATAQAATAWGKPGAAVVARCGVEPPGPTTDQCVTVDDGMTSIDWVTQQDNTGQWTFTTYGRHPAVEVVVSPEVTATRSTSFIQELGPAVSLIPATRHCVG